MSRRCLPLDDTSVLETLNLDGSGNDYVDDLQWHDSDDETEDRPSIISPIPTRAMPLVLGVFGSLLDEQSGLLAADQLSRNTVGHRLPPFVAFPNKVVPQTEWPSHDSTPIHFGSACWSLSPHVEAAGCTCSLCVPPRIDGTTHGCNEATFYSRFSLRSPSAELDTSGQEGLMGVEEGWNEQELNILDVE